MLKMNARWLCLLLAVVWVVFAGGGCQVVNQSRLPEEEGEEKPWNSPAAWEQRIPGL